jgi:hypothetical protein
MTLELLSATTTGALAEADALGELSGFAVRPFGEATSDLALDLTEPVGPDALTDVLAACLADGEARPATREWLTAAPVGDRVAAVMAIAAITGDGRFAVPLLCPVETCRDAIEIELTWNEIRAAATGATRDPFEVDANGVRYRVRRPIAADQDRWRRAAPGGAGLEPREVVASLIVDGPLDRLSAERVAQIEAALDDHDPLICFGLAVVCPTCGVTSRHELSLVSIAADVLRRSQGRLLDDIDELARAYGWSEGAILAIPAWRRARYRALIGAAR